MKNVTKNRIFYLSDTYIICCLLPMIIIIPLGGKGERFKNLGYRKPKPLISVLGKEIICWLLDNLNTMDVELIIIPYNEELVHYRFEDFLKNKYHNLNFKFIELKTQTRGACETINISVTDLDKKYHNMPVMCVDGDNFFTVDVVKMFNKKINGVFSFEDVKSEPIYSYIKIENSKITDMVEKEKISDHACCGIYCFESAQVLYQESKKVLDDNILQKGEFYMSGLVKNMILKNYDFVPFVIPQSSFICLGTPLQVKVFCNNIPCHQAINKYNKELVVKPRVFCFDLDNTLVTFTKKHGDYTSVAPIEKNINLVRYLKSLGHTIIIHTARRMKTHGGNMGKLLKDIGKITFDTLEEFDIPYDEIYFGKPNADFYIDDKAINCFDNIEKEIGFYQSKIDPRSFNELHGSSIETYIKRSSNPNGLIGEIYWYLNIPEKIKDMFPVIIKYDAENSMWYEMEKIQGIPLSKIYLSGDLSTSLLQHVLNSFVRIHESGNTSEEKLSTELLYSNYAEKLKERYENYDYSIYEGSEKLYKKLLDFYEYYQDKKYAKCTVIHGDPVLTNIMINQFGKIKFIDMRGRVGSSKNTICTIYGDIFYDYAKLYQSFYGYDEILNETTVSSKYKNEIINYLEEHIIKKYDKKTLENIKMLAAGLYFTLIPLHDNNKCSEYYKLSAKLAN